MLSVDSSSSGVEYSYFLSLTGMFSDNNWAEIIVKSPDLKKKLYTLHIFVLT